MRFLLTEKEHNKKLDHQEHKEANIILKFTDVLLRLKECASCPHMKHLCPKFLISHNSTDCRILCSFRCNTGVNFTWLVEGICFIDTPIYLSILNLNTYKFYEMRISL